VQVPGKIAAMARGDHINVSEDRAVGHMALRAPAGQVRRVFEDVTLMTLFSHARRCVACSLLSSTARTWCLRCTPCSTASG
jgi:glucose-6-phosphate isomerase